MRIIKYTLLIGLAMIIAVCGGAYIYLHNLGPKYSGEIKLSGLRAEVEIFFDTYGIPHIYAQNEEDVYFALGYVHAQERLFQMEMLRRVAAGRLAEILGQDLLKTDRYFRTLGIDQVAQRSADIFFKADTEPFQKAAHAYLNGINQFLARGKTPIEFTILGIPKEPFTPRDIYRVGMFMSFGFASGFQMDPLTERAYRRLGWKYLKDWAIDWPPGAEKIPVYRRPSAAAAPDPGRAINRILSHLPVAAWIGSNGWVVSPAKSKTGRVLFANDTHMSYSQPSVWYEAHLECPGFSFYGNHAAGMPFGLVGHNRFAAWGLTMFENDDVDFYREKANPQNPNQVWVDDHWEDLQIRREIIKVKGAADVVMQVRMSRHGPIINDVDEALAATETVPVAVWWSATKFPLTTIQAFYMLAHADRFAAARKAASLINVPGLNVMYGDRDGNIAWWAASKLVKRPPHVNPKLFLDGAGGQDEPLGWYDFTENPQSENPPSGFVYSANNQPEKMGGVLYPGYYVPEDRARRILEYLRTGKKWTVAHMQQMSTDGTCAVKPSLARQMAHIIAADGADRRSPLHQKVFRMLKTWDGNHRLGDAGPVIYYKLLYYIYENAMADELGPDDFRAFISTHLMKRTTAVFVPNDNSLWWDDIRTADVKETRALIFSKSFEQTIDDLKAQLGDDTAKWQWGKVHTLEHGHVLGMKKPLDKIFNVGPFPAMGGNEVINNTGFKLNRNGRYKVYFGPAMRRVIDFADIENSLSVNPSGQSGYFLSPHYDDQAPLFNSGKFRKQMMNRTEIEQHQTAKLILKPR